MVGYTRHFITIQIYTQVSTLHYITPSKFSHIQTSHTNIFTSKGNNISYYTKLISIRLTLLRMSSCYDENTKCEQNNKSHSKCRSEKHDHGCNSRDKCDRCASTESLGQSDSHQDIDCCRPKSKQCGCEDKCRDVTKRSTSRNDGRKSRSGGPCRSRSGSNPRRLGSRSGSQTSQLSRCGECGKPKTPRTVCSSRKETQQQQQQQQRSLDSLHSNSEQYTRGPRARRDSPFSRSGSRGSVRSVCDSRADSQNRNCTCGKNKDVCRSRGSNQSYGSQGSRGGSQCESGHNLHEAEYKKSEYRESQQSLDCCKPRSKSRCSNESNDILCDDCGKPKSRQCDKPKSRCEKPKSKCCEKPKRDECRSKSGRSRSDKSRQCDDKPIDRHELCEVCVTIETESQHSGRGKSQKACKK